MGKKNNNMLIYAAVASVAIVYILYKLLYSKEGFATTETPMTCGEFCPNGLCLTVGTRALACYGIYYAQKDLGTGEFKCNVSGFKGVIYPHTFSDARGTILAGKINTRQDIPVCFGYKVHDPFGELPRQESLAINTTREYQSSCDPRIGEISVIPVDENGERPSYIRPSTDINERGEEVPWPDEQQNEIGRRKVLDSARCIRIKPVGKSKDVSRIPHYECKGPAGSQTALFPFTIPVTDRQQNRMCMISRVDTGEPTPYFLD